jgi:hypothetical protein
MKNKTATTLRPTVSNLYSGQVVQAGYNRRSLLVDPNRFVGFKVNGMVYSNLKLLKNAFGVTNLRDLEAEADRLELGSVTAEWYNNDEGYLWGSYLWEGSFRVGTSADKLVLRAA